MKQLKKVLSLVLALAMAFSLSAAVFADEGDLTELKAKYDEENGVVVLYADAGAKISSYLIKITDESGVLEISDTGVESALSGIVSTNSTSTAKSVAFAGSASNPPAVGTDGKVLTIKATPAAADAIIVFTPDYIYKNGSDEYDVGGLKAEATVPGKGQDDAVKLATVAIALDDSVTDATAFKVTAYTPETDGLAAEDFEVTPNGDAGYTVGLKAGVETSADFSAAKLDTAAVTTGTVSGEEAGADGISFTYTPDAAEAAAPVFAKNLASATYQVGAEAAALDGTATVADGGSVTYAWYSNTTASSEGGTATDVSTATYTPSTVTAGTFYYYVVATNAADETKSATSNVATITVTEGAPEKYTIAVVDGSADKAEATQGQTVTITAATIEGKVFVNWTGEGVAFEDSETSVTSFVMPAANVTVTANFKDEVKAADAPIIVVNKESGNTTVSFQAEDGASIYYTLDGSAPTEASTKYDGTPVTIKETTTVKAVAIAEGKSLSAVSAKNITITAVTADDVDAAVEAAKQEAEEKGVDVSEIPVSIDATTESESSDSTDVTVPINSIVESGQPVSVATDSTDFDIPAEALEEKSGTMSLTVENIDSSEEEISEDLSDALEEAGVTESMEYSAVADIDLTFTDADGNETSAPQLENGKYVLRMKGWAEFILNETTMVGAEDSAGNVWFYPSKANAEDGGDYYEVDGEDVVIYTSHFTKFFVLNEAPAEEADYKFTETANGSRFNVEISGLASGKWYVIQIESNQKAFVQTQTDSTSYTVVGAKSGEKISVFETEGEPAYGNSDVLSNGTNNNSEEYVVGSSVAA